MQISESFRGAKGDNGARALRLPIPALAVSRVVVGFFCTDDRMLHGDRRPCVIVETGAALTADFAT